MLLKSMSRERGRRPPSPGEPVIVKVLPLPVTPYVKSRPTSKQHHKDKHLFAGRKQLKSPTFTNFDYESIIECVL